VSHKIKCVHFIKFRNLTVGFIFMKFYFIILLFLEVLSGNFFCIIIDHQKQSAGRETTGIKAIHGFGKFSGKFSGCFQI